MSQSLIVVESPTKVRTIRKYLGKDFDVLATMGHIKDLPEKKIGRASCRERVLPTV